MPTCRFTKKPLSHILFQVFCLHFLRMNHHCFFRRGFESVRAQFLSVKSSVTCNLSVQSRFISVNFLHVEYGTWRFFLSTDFVNKLEFFVPYNIKITRTFFFLLYLLFFYKKLIILHHGDNNFLFWHLYQIHSFNNNINDEGMIASHWMCVISL